VNTAEIENADPISNDDLLLIVIRQSAALWSHRIRARARESRSELAVSGNDGTVVPESLRSDAFAHAQ
jgi:hypothetical protein